MSDKAKILFVDDEPNILDGLRRQLRKRFDVTTALGGDEGLAALDEHGPFPVVVSDMKMPGMNGAEFLSRVRVQHPDTVRMILSGQSELDSAIAAINDGKVFRFLTKPCETDQLICGLEVALKQHRLKTVEKELLEKTLFGAVEMLTEILSLVNPEAFSRSLRVRQYAEGIAAALGLEGDWQLRLAAMLSQIGCISLPSDVLTKANAGEPMTADERDMFASHPHVAAKLLKSIPRLETVSRIVEGELDRCDCAALSDDVTAWEPAMLGSQILRAAIEFERMLIGGERRPVAVQRLRDEHGVPSPIADAALTVGRAGVCRVSKSVTVRELAVKMVIDEDLTTKAGALLVKRGEEVSIPMLERLHNFARGQGIVEPFRVLVEQ